MDTATLSQHPRFSDYKNTHKASGAQEQRRKEFLQRQNEFANEKAYFRARINHINHLRNLAENTFEFEEDDEDDTEKLTEEEEQKRPNIEKRSQRIKKNRYEGELMTSEWLCDIPDALSKVRIFIFGS